MINESYSKFKLAICQIFHPRLHGYTESSNINIVGHYLVFFEIEINEFLENYFKNGIDYLKSFYNDINFSECPHPFIRNYSNIVHSENYIKIDIVKTEILNGREEVAYIKTFWIKIFQRKWKKEYKKRQKIIRTLSNPKYLLKREINGK